MTGIQYRSIDRHETALIDEAYVLMSQGILKSEQRPEAEFKALCQRPDYAFVGAFAGERLVGVAVSWLPESMDCWLFEYAVVAADRRGGGIGGQLFEATQMLVGADRTALIEVDADTGDAIQSRRLRFYDALGCRRLGGVDYILPLDAHGTPPPMWLLARTRRDASSVACVIVAGWLRRIYTEVYRKAPDDPRLVQMIAGLSGNVALEAIAPQPTP